MKHHTSLRIRPNILCLCLIFTILGFHKSWGQTPTFSIQLNNSDITGACAGIGITFTNTSTVSAANLKWDFGDNYILTNNNSIAHTYTLGGIYTITLTNTLTQEKYSRSITIYKNPTANLQLSDSIVCVGSNITFTSNSSEGSAPIKYYSWTFGDGNVLPLTTTPTTNYVYNQGGTYVPLLIVRDDNGCSGTSLGNKHIKVNNNDQQSSFLANGEDFYSCTNTIDIENTTNENGKTGITYLWNFGDNTTSSEKSPQNHTYNSSGVYKITLQTILPGLTGCTPSYTKSVYIGKPTLSINTSSSICQGDALSISSSADISGFINSPTDIQWSASNGIQFSNDSTSISSNTPGNYTLSATNKNGCPAPTSTTINILAAPTIDLSITPNKGLCVGIETNANTSITNNSTISKYIWYPEGINGPIQDTTSSNTYKHTYESAGQYSYAVKAIGINGCMGTQSYPLSVSQECIDNGQGSAYNPIFSFYSKSCEDKYTTIITNKQSSKTVQYWTVGNSSTQYAATNGQTATITLPNAPKGYIYTINTYFTDGSNDLNRKITIIDETADFDIVNNDNSKLYCANNSFSFLSTNYVNVANIKTFSWTITDAQGNTLQTSNEQNLNYAFSKAGTYTILLSIADIRDNSCVSQKSKTIVVNGISGDFSADKNSFCIANPTVNFQLNNVSTPSNLTKITWSFGDGNQTSFSNPSPTNSTTYTYPNNNNSFTSYTVSATLEDQMGCTIKINKPDFIKTYLSKIGFYKKDTVLCSSKNIIIDNTSDAKDATYTWLVGGVTQTYTNTNAFNATFNNIANPSDIDVSLHLVDGGGCVKDLAVKSYIKYREPVAKYAISNLEVFYNCPPFTLSIKNVSENFDSSHWTINDDFSSIQKDSFFYTVLHPGPISITLNSVLDGCIDTYKEDYTVRGPVAKLLTKDTIGCTPYTSLLYVSDNSDIVSYQWDKGDSITYVTDKTSDSIRFTYEKGGVYYPSVTFVGKEGCSDRQEYPSPIIALQSVNLTYKNNYIFCSNDSILYLTAKADNVQKFTWTQSSTTGYMSDSTGSPIGVIPTENTTYHVFAQSGNSCPSDSGDIEVKRVLASVVSITPNTVTQPAGTVFTFTPTITNENLNVQYYWSPDFRINNRYLKSPTIIADKDTTYFLNIKNENGCSSSDSVHVIVLCNTSKLLMANAFTPNGDGKNDRFYVTGYGIQKVEHFTLFDRWGKKVFERNNISANDFSQGWDGTVNGSQAMPGTYIYLADIICSEGNRIPIKGSVVLIR